MRLANAMSLGQRLRYERQRLNWSQERLAEAIGTTAMSIHRWEHGQAVPQVRYRERLCRVFNTSADELFAPSIDEDSFAYGHQLIKKGERPVSDARTLRKIACPALPPTILHREALLRRLGEMIAGSVLRAAEGAQAYKLVLLHAPAGYGKTTLLADIARQTKLPCCWYVLDRADADMLTFLETLLMSIRSRFPQFGAALDALLAGIRAGGANQRSEDYLESVVAALAEALATEITERFALILCNYEHVNASQEITTLINALLQLPSACVLVIESRALPALDFASLLAHRELYILSSDLLPLSAQEIGELATLQGAAPLSETEAEQLAAAFDGWMAGRLKHEQLQARLRLAACHLAQAQTSEALRYLEAVASTLARYDDYKQWVLIELRRLPALQQAVKTLPALARLRTLLYLETGPHETPAPAQPPLPAADDQLMTSNPSQLRILALGEPAILIDEQPVTRWRIARAMELFFFLLNADRPLRKEQIIAALWPQADEHNSSQTFRSTLYYLRRALGESCLVSQAGTYTLSLISLYGNQVWYDIAAFEERYATAKQALGAKDDEAARDAFLAMVELYRGDYVQSFYSEWCTFRRDELRRAYLDARYQLAQRAWRGAQIDESLSHYQQMLAMDQCLEEAHYGIMCCYLHLGKRGLALRQYHRCADALQHELAVTPGATIQNLYRRLMESASN